MKNKILVALLLLGVTAVVAEDIDTILSKIKTKRLSPVSEKSILDTPSPMTVLVKSNESNSSTDSNKSQKLKPQEEKFVLTAIMNGSANINGKWVKLGEKIGTYKLEDIMDDSIFLKSAQKEKIIFFEKNSNKINISIGR
ncbi:MAG TPA: hypothetical protein ENL00_02985 [Nitratifractor sp.]|nr:hypothetical protein [Nitratifractor sp.]HHD74770.1 hypothetical protein [Nitratifractor sp.]